MVRKLKQPAFLFEKFLLIYGGVAFSLVVFWGMHISITYVIIIPSAPIFINLQRRFPLKVIICLPSLRKSSARSFGEQKLTATLNVFWIVVNINFARARIIQNCIHRGQDKFKTGVLEHEVTRVGSFITWVKLDKETTNSNLWYNCEILTKTLKSPNKQTEKLLVQELDAKLSGWNLLQK